MAPVDVGDGDELDVFEADDGVHVFLASGSCSDDADADAVVGA